MALANKYRPKSFTEVIPKKGDYLYLDPPYTKSIINYTYSSHSSWTQDDDLIPWIGGLPV